MYCIMNTECEAVRPSVLYDQSSRVSQLVYIVHRLQFCRLERAIIGSPECPVVPEFFLNQAQKVLLKEKFWRGFILAVS